MHAPWSNNILQRKMSNEDPFYDNHNISAGFVPPSGMLHASGYQIPYPQHLHSGYQPPFMPTQLSQQGIAQLLSSCCCFYDLSAKDLNQP